MTVQRSTLAQQAYEAIRADILSNRLPPRTKLIVRNLTERLGLSPTPIKAALAGLEREGFVTTIPHRGYFVPEFSRDDMREIYELREVIDGIAARKAAASPERGRLVSHLQELLTRQHELVEHGEISRYSDLDLQFHHAIWELSGNQRLLQAADNLLGQVRFGSGGSSRLPGRLPVALDEHADIIAAIGAGDSAGAERKSRQHVSLAAEAFDRYYASQADSAEGSQPHDGTAG